MEPVIDIKALLTPIAGENRAGEDMSFSNEFDLIKEARRAEDALDQGEWKHDVKVADWPRVRETTVELLTGRTKDLQLAAWLTEALTHLHGFKGLFSGLMLTRQLLSEFWEELYPSKEDGPARRVGKLSWLNDNLPGVIAFIPLCAKSNGGYSLIHWNEAKEIDNVARKSAEAAKRLVEEDKKIPSDVINKAVAATDEPFYEALYAEINACQDEFKLLDTLVDEKFESESPSLAALRSAIGECVQVVTRIAKDKGMLEGKDESSTEAVVAGAVAAGAAARPGSREEALRKLAEVAQYFRAFEPHSPVALLVDRAAKWGRMSLEQWLLEVVKDQDQLGKLYELLGVQQPPSG